jgi:hypothetical protein
VEERRVRPVLVAAATALAALALAAPAGARVPHAFVGVYSESQLLHEHGLTDREYDVMVTAGVGSVRDLFDWNAAQPYASWSDVPEDRRPNFRDENGVPTDWSGIDLQVRLAAQRRIRLLPVVQVTPEWAAVKPGDHATGPSDPATYARFLDALVRRYGPNGSFWAENPAIAPRPIRDWQIWNEPHFRVFWNERPYERDYVRLLAAARAAIKAADRGARVVLAGLANESWRYLADLYRAGARPYFDAFAAHPFTRKVAGVVEILRRARRVARRFGDARKPVLVTETSWTSGQGELERGFGFDSSPRGQAAKARKVLRLLARERRRLRIDSVFWYTWLSRDSDRTYPFDYAGLNRLEGGSRVVRKPAFRAFRGAALRLVGCRRKEGRADRCAR